MSRAAHPMIFKLAEEDLRTFQVFTDGPTSHPKGDFVVDDDFYASLRAFYEFQAARGYYAPILRQHTEEGYVYGRVVDMARTKVGVDFTVAFAKGMAQAFDDGFLDSWSPAFYSDFVDPHTGDVFVVALRELSFVGVRYLKNLPGASPHYQLAEGGAVTITQEHTMTTPATPATPATTANAEGDDKSTEARLDAIEKTLSDLAPIVEHAKKLMEGEDDDPVKDGEPVTAAAEPGKGVEVTENAEVIALAQRVDELEAENAKLDVARRLPGADAKTTTMLCELRATRPKLYETTITSLSEAEAARKTTTSTTSTERGGSGPTTLAEPAAKVIALAEKLKGEGVPRGAKMLRKMRQAGYGAEESARASAVVFDGANA